MRQGIFVGFWRFLAAVILNRFVTPRVRDGRLGRRLFEAVAKLSVSVAATIICWRLNDDGKVEVFLVKREAGEAYGGLWHFPGCILVPGETLENLCERVLVRELGLSHWLASALLYVKELQHLLEIRGHLLEKLYTLQRPFVKEDPLQVFGKAQWFLLDDLPEPMFKWHREHVVPLLERMARGS